MNNNMCLSIPGKVIEISENKFLIDYETQKREVNFSVIDVKIGDYVIVSNKIIINKVPKEEAIKYLDMIRNIGNKQIRVEEYFFKYAFPCTYVKLDRKDITIEEYQELEKRFLENDPPDREILEKVYAPAFIFINELAIKMKKDKWDFEVIKRYWEEEHNNIINQGKGNYMDSPEFLKDFCKTQIAKITKKDEKRHLLIVNYNGKERAVFDCYVPNAKVGDKVVIHHSYAIEKVTYRLDKEIEEKIKAEAIKQLENGKPGWDIPHTLIAVDWLRKLIEKEGGDEKILLTAIYLHDIGYNKLKRCYNYEDVKKTKETHEEIGAEFAEKILKNLDEYYSDEIEEIVNLVKYHDYIDDINSFNRQLIMEADSLSAIDWERVKPSFNKEECKKYFEDFKQRRINKFKTETGKEFLKQLLKKAEKYLN